MIIFLFTETLDITKGKEKQIKNRFFFQKSLLMANKIYTTHTHTHKSFFKSFLKPDVVFYVRKQTGDEFLLGLPAEEIRVQRCWDTLKKTLS